MKITMVKKIRGDGTPCRKCAEVEQKMAAAGHFDAIDNVVVADERDPASPGMLLAADYGVERAPFFIVEKPAQAPQIYTVYFKFVKDVLKQRMEEKDELQEILEDNPDLDFL